VQDSCIERGVRITGSELVGLIPLEAMLDAGRHFLKKQERSLGVDDAELIHIAVKSLGLDELGPFDPQKKIIEYQLQSLEDEKLIQLTAKGLANETASESMAPGGGSISAYVGALGVSLATMVANLSANKPGWEEKLKFFSDWACKGQEIKNEMLFLVDEDTRSFNAIIDAIRLPKETAEEKKFRLDSIENASQYAAEVPFKVMQTAARTIDIIKAMIENGNKASITDAGVGALCCITAIEGAYMNIRVNTKDLSDTDFADLLNQKAHNLLQESKGELQALVEAVHKQIS